MNNASVFFRAAAELDATGEPFATVTIAAARGSVPQEAGAKMIVTARGRRCGTVGGGRVEEAAIAEARALLDAAHGPACLTREWNLQKDIGMTCGGVVTMFFEVFHRASWPVVIFGAGHVAQALVRVLVTLECRISVIDSRRDWLAALPEVSKVSAVHAGVLESEVAAIPDGAFVLLMTQGHRTDRPVLERILRTRRFPYLGVIGSRSKAATLRRELREAGVPAARLKDFRCPLGLPLGKDSPEEIAISIAAELLEVRGR